MCPLPRIVCKVFFNSAMISVGLDMKSRTILLEWISFPNRLKINSILVVRYSTENSFIRPRVWLSLGQDVHPLTFKLYPQRSESVENGNRTSPNRNTLQRVWVIFISEARRFVSSFVRISPNRILSILLQISKFLISNPFQALRFVYLARPPPPPQRITI